VEEGSEPEHRARDLSHDLRPHCPVCDTPFRDIEFANVENQKGQARYSPEPIRQQLRLFCGHKVELTFERYDMSMRAL
jgi:hypothetical protein